MPAAAPPEKAKQAEEAPEMAAKDADQEFDGLRAEDKAKERGKTMPSLEESLRKAERLFANREWNAAALAYQDLLRRFPGHKDVPKWRERQNASLVAEQESRKSKATKAAKAKTSNSVSDQD
jgi:hypothetical protein